MEQTMIRVPFDFSTLQTMTLDGVPYTYATMNPEQQTLLRHIVILGQNLEQAQMDFEQAKVAQAAFLSMLKRSCEDVVTAGADVPNA
jgi:hypothetical protein